jgi:hypothetical protein
MQPDMEYINLVDRVLDQIVEDVRNGDLTAIQELLVYCEVNAMKQYLPEEKQNA